MNHEHKPDANEPGAAQDADSASPPSGECFDQLVIVGVGASTGGLEAFRKLLQHVPVRDDLAFVLVQHLSPTVPSLLPELLAPDTSMRVCEATDGIKVEGGCVYVITPDSTLSLQEGHLQVIHPAPLRAMRWPIDTFFSSLAQEQGQCAVAVVLAGNGNDGARGLQAIKDYGGLAIAQAGYDHVAMSGMPTSAAATGLVDDVLPVEEIGDRLLAHCRYVRGNRERVNAKQLRQDVTPLLDELFALCAATWATTSPTTSSRPWSAACSGACRCCRSIRRTTTWRARAATRWRYGACSPNS